MKKTDGGEGRREGAEKQIGGGGEKGGEKRGSERKS